MTLMKTTRYTVQIINGEEKVMYESPVRPAKKDTAREARIEKTLADIGAYLDSTVA